MRRVLVGALLAVAFGASPATAAGDVVATSGDYALHARHGKGGLCLRLTGPKGLDAPGGCQAPPTSPFHPVQVPHYLPDAPFALAVPDAVARVTADDQAVDTVAAAGFRARFVLIAGAGADPLMRMFDAGGALIGAVRDEYARFRLRGGQVIFRARHVTIRARRSFELAPNPLELDRTVPETCLEVRTGSFGVPNCTLDSRLHPMDVDAEPACAPARMLVRGLAAPRVRGVEVTLGNGARRSARTRRLPAALGPARLVALSIPRGQAVRSVRGLDSRGRVVERRGLGIAPSGFPCRHGEGSVGFGFDELIFGEGGRHPVAAPVVVAQTAGRSLRVADGGGTTLCSGVGKLRCSTPPVDARFAFIHRHGRVLSAVLSRDVASVDLILETGRTVSAATTDGAAYTGRYAGRVRFLAVALPAGVRVRRAVPRDGDGRRLGDGIVAGSRTHRSRRRAGAGLVLVRETTRTESAVFAFRCIRPRHPFGEFGRFGICSGENHGGPTAEVSVSCSPRRAILFGTLPRGTAGVTVLLAGGTRRAPTVKRFRRLGRIWMTVLPRHARVTGLRYTGKLGRHGVRVLPAARQCGYDEAIDVL